MVEHLLDRAYAALSHPTRRELLERLRRDEASVTELASPFDISLAAVSKHIRVLEDAGLVTREVIGREHQLRLEPKPLQAASRWLQDYARLWEARLDRLDQALRRGGRS